MTTEIEDLRFVWPSALFQDEARELLTTGYADDAAAVRLLFAEAFSGGTGAELVREVCETLAPYRGRWRPAGPVTVDAWDLNEESDTAVGNAQTRQRQLLEEVLRRAAEGELSDFVPKRYWSARQLPPHVPEAIDPRQLRAEFLTILEQLDHGGYLDTIAGPNCCDAGSDRDTDGAAALERQWGRPAKWPLTSEGAAWVNELDDDTFLDLIEVFHDVVARPRKSYWHDFCQEWDYSDHDTRAGQRVYVWRVNSLLERSTVHLWLAHAGVDAGLLVRTVPDDRAQLPQSVAAATKDPVERARIEHAIAQQRTRHPSRHTRREAVRNLGDVLEHRGPQAKRLLGSRDESDLFHIINRFDIRHMNKNQQADFGDEFLDYLYWTFLASVDLLNKLEERSASPVT